MYVVATRGTTEEEFARRQMQHLAGKGVQVREQTVDRADADETSETEASDDGEDSANDQTAG
jgi:DNA excision repair protein ERCC-3